MPLLPILPIIDGESLISFMHRTARFHANRHLFSFLEMLEIPRGALVAPNAALIERLSLVTGVAVEAIERMSIRSLALRRRRLANQVFHAEFANFEQTTFCPACLLQDGLADSPSRGVRVGRIAWQLEPVRACPSHGILLHRQPNAGVSQRLQVMEDVAPSDEALHDLVVTAERLRPSRLQGYVVDRLSGSPGPAWLDGQDIDLAARACEMLGVILTQDPDIALPTVTSSGWSRAGDVGFEFASRGEDGVRDALQLAMERLVAKGGRGGPQKAFGKLYKWLQFNKNSKPLGPVRDVTREFILDHFPIEAGSDLFGETVDRQRVHSVYSLAAASGEHPRTIYRAAVLSGLCDGEPDKPVAHQVFDADASAKLVDRIKNSISTVKLPGYLNCNRVLAQQLVRNGLIPRLLPDSPAAVGVLRNVALSDVDSFWDRLMAHVEVVGVPRSGMVDLNTAAGLSRWPIIDIVVGILDGAISQTETTDASLKIKGIRVNPTEVRTVLTRRGSIGYVGADEAARMIGMHRQAFANLVRLRRPDGSPYLRHRLITNSKGAEFAVYAVEDIAAFTVDHVALKDYAASRSFAPKVMKAKLDAQGVLPIIDGHDLGRFFYRKTDLRM